MKKTNFTRFSNSKIHLLNLVNDLEKNGLIIVIFGGWSVELQNIKRPWQHKDIDLLLVDNNFKSLINIAVKKGWKICKSYSHKKAFLIDNVMVEVFLISQSAGHFVTNFVGDKGNYEFIWPKNYIEEMNVCNNNYKLASKDSMNKYFNEHRIVHALSPWH